MSTITDLLGRGGGTCVVVGCGRREGDIQGNLDEWLKGDLPVIPSEGQYGRTTYLLMLLSQPLPSQTICLWIVLHYQYE